MVSCDSSILDITTNGSSYNASVYSSSSGSSRNNNKQAVPTDRELILTLQEYFRRNQMSNLQGFYFMDADTNQQTIGANDMVQIYKRLGMMFITVDRVQTLMGGFVMKEGGEMNVHGYLRFMASAYAPRHVHED